MDEYESCAVCLETFRNPKILECSHTFCTECLLTCMRKSRRQHQFQCPLCRHCMKLPKSGISGLLTNYFSRDISLQIHTEKLSDFDQSGGSISDDADTLNLTSHGINCEISLPRRFSRLGIYNATICTKIKATLLNALVVSDIESSADNCINSVFGLPDFECLTILSGGPFLVRYRLEGTESERIFVPGGQKIYDTICRKDKSILVTCPDANKILMYKNDNWSEFANTRGEIVDMSYFSDGRILVGVNNFHQDTTSKLLILSPCGRLLKSISNDKVKFIPFAVAVNKKTDRICISDTFNHCVWILTDNATLIAKYDTELSPLGGTNYLLTPLGISTDFYGNIVFAERATQSLHVIDAEGRFIGIVCTDEEDQFGEPFSVSAGADDVIWVGDREDAVVRAFKVTDFINNI